MNQRADTSSMPSAPHTGRPVRTALLGCGRIAQLVHLPVLLRLRGVELSLVADPSAPAREAALAVARSVRGPATRATADWREALTDPQTDAVVIATPSHLHAEAAAAAVAAGKHVYVEKPVGINLEQARQVQAAADEATGNSLVAMAGFNFRFHPTFVELRRRLLAGEVGQVVAVRTIFTVPPRALPQWKAARATGGGAMLDQFSHHADLLRYLLADVIDTRPASFFAQRQSVLSEADTAHVQTTLVGGQVVQSTLSLATAEQDVIEILGTTGRLVADRVAMHCWYEQAGGGYNRPERTVRMVESLTRSLKLGRHVVNPLGTTAHDLALREFTDAIRERRAPSVTLADGARALAWVLAAEASAEAGAAVAFDAEAFGVSAEAGPAEAGAAEAGADSPPSARELPPIRFPEPDDERPLASVVLVASSTDESVRQVVRCVRRQTLADRLELIVIADTDADAQAVAKLPDGEAETLLAVRTHGLNRPIVNVDAEVAQGVLLSNGPVTCCIEDHAYPAVDWVERMLAAYQGPEGERLAAAGSVVKNANPDYALSWVNLLIAYGTWVEPLAPAETLVGNHNVSFRTDAVAGYGDTLGARLSRAGTIMQDLRARGFDVVIARDALVHHTNPSRLSSTLKLRIDSGRLYAAGRVKAERWPAWRRAGYAMLWPVIVPIRWGLLRPKFTAAPGRVRPGLALGLLLDALGQGIGFAFGPGGSDARLQAFEIGRLRHVNAADRAKLTRGAVGLEALPAPEVQQQPTAVGAA